MMGKMMKLVMIGCLVIVVSACGASKNNTSNTNQAAKTTSTQSKKNTQTAEQPVWNPNGKTVHLVMYVPYYGSADAVAQIFQPLVKNLPKNIKIKFLTNTKGISLKKMIVGGQQVDIIGCSLGAFSWIVKANNAQYDISSLVKKDKVDLSRFDPASIQAIKQLGGLYGLPYVSGGLVLYYNKSIFDKFGEPYPKPGMTWDQVNTIAKKLTRTDNGKQYLGLSVDMLHYRMMNQYSEPMVDPKTDKPTFNQDIWKKIIQKTLLEPTNNTDYQKWIMKHGLPNNGTFLKTRNLAMFVMNHGLTSKDLNYAEAPLPVFADKPGIGTQPYPNYLFLSTTSKYKDAAMEVLKIMTSNKVQMAMSKAGNVTPLVSDKIRNALNADHPEVQMHNVAKAMFTNKFAMPAPVTKYDHLMPGLDWKSLALRKVDVNTLLRTEQQKFSKKIATEKGK